MRTEPAAKRALPNVSLPPLKRPFDGIREQVRNLKYMSGFIEGDSTIF